MRLQCVHDFENYPRQPTAKSNPEHASTVRDVHAEVSTRYEKCRTPLDRTLKSLPTNHKQGMTNLHVHHGHTTTAGRANGNTAA